MDKKIANKRHMAQVIRLAQNWHGGQWTALYSLASTNRLHSQEDALRAIRECFECIELNPVLGFQTYAIIGYAISCYPNLINYCTECEL